MTGGTARCEEHRNTGTWTVESGPLLLQLCNLSISVNSSKRQIAVLTGLLVIKVIDVF